MKDKINNFKIIQEEDEKSHRSPTEQVKNSIDANIDLANHASHVFDIFLTKIVHTITHFAGGRDAPPPHSSAPDARAEGRHRSSDDHAPGGGR